MKFSEYKRKRGIKKASPKERERKKSTEGREKSKKRILNKQKQLQVEMRE
jgi:hypothetical protein